jgi:Type II secretory pathway, component PulD
VKKVKALLPILVSLSIAACSSSPHAPHITKPTPPRPPIFHKYGTPASLKPFLPATGEGEDRSIVLEARYPWLKKMENGYSAQNITLQDAIAGLIPAGIPIHYGDVDAQKVISFDFSPTSVYELLAQITRLAHTNFDIHRDYVYIGTREAYRTTIPAPDVMNQYTGMNGNMLSAMGSSGMGGMGGMGMGMGGMGMGMGGMGMGMGGMGMGGMGGGMGMGSSSSSAGLLMVTSSSGMQTFWQDVTNVLNGLTSGNCSSPLATAPSQMSMSGTGTGIGTPGIGGPGGAQGYPQQAYNAPTNSGFSALGPGSPGNGFSGAAGQAAGAAQGGPGRPGGPSYDISACGRIRISPDSGLGYVYVEDKVENVFYIREFVERLKRQLNRKVYLKIDVLEVDLTKQNQYGMNWSVLFSKVAHLAGGAFSLSGGAPSGALAGLSSAGNSNYSLGVVSGTSNSAILQALESVTNVHVDSQPRILAQSGPAVTINAVKNEPYVAGEMPFVYGGLSSASETIPEMAFVPVGVSLVVTPQLHENKNVLSLYVAPTLNILEGFDTFDVKNVGTFQQPIVSSRSLSSQFTVRGGDTIIFGGLIDTKINKQHWSVPVLGKLFPSLFAGYNNKKSVTQLVFLVTPVIVDSNSSNKLDKLEPSSAAASSSRTDSTFQRLTPQPNNHNIPKL